MFVVFLLRHLELTVGLCRLGVWGAYGAVERRFAAPAVVGRLGLVLDTDSGFAGQDGRTDETGLPPLNPPARGS